MSRLRPRFRSRFVWGAAALISVWLVLSMAPLGEAGPAAEDPEPFRVVFSGSMFSNVNPNDAKASAKVWGQQVAEEMGVNILLETRIEDDMAVIRDDILAKRIELVALTTREFLAIEDQIPVGPILVGEQAGKQTQEYLLLVSTTGEVEALADLRGKTLLSYRDPMACLAERWLTLILQAEEETDLSAFFSSVVPCPELTAAVLPVFFGQSDACLVTRVGYDTMVELNPQVGKSLRVLATSPPVVPMVVFIRGGYKPELRDKAVRGMLKVDQSTSGRQLLTLFRSNGLSLVSDEALDTARALMAGELPALTSVALTQDPTGME